MRGKHVLWLTFTLALTPLFFNCHKAIDFDSYSTAVEGGGGREPAVDDMVYALDNGPRDKVELKPETLVRIPAAQASMFGGSVAAKASGSEEVDAIPEGARLMVTVDNACLAEKRQTAAASQKTSPESLSEEAQRHSGTEQLEELELQAYAFHAPTAAAVEALVIAADADDCVLRVENDELHVMARPRISRPADTATEEAGHTTAVTNDTSFGQLEHLPSIKAPLGWNTFYSQTLGLKRDVVVAIIDSGIDYTHPDLAANMWKSSGGFFGRDFVNNDDDPKDDFDHGTHVAGLVGAVSDNGVGIAGVMGKRVKLMAVKSVDNTGSAFTSQVVNGIRYAADNGAEVANLSLGFNQSVTAVRDAIQYAVGKGTVVVVAAGNDNREITTTNFVSPAGFTKDIPGTLAVASIETTTGARADYSNFSSTYLQIAAPGSKDSAAQVGLLSTVSNNGYQRFEGTSMASPIVAAAAALTIGMLKSNNQTATPAAVTGILLESARRESSLATVVKDGAVLDLDRLARLLKWRFLIDGDAGAEAP